MKTLVPLTAFVALAASGFSSAQTAAYSKPSGYVTQQLNANQFNLVGLTLQNPPVAAGAFTSVSGKTLTDTNGKLSSESGRTYVLELTSGTLAGGIQVVDAVNLSATQIVTADDLPSMGLEIGDTYLIRLAPTVEEIFGTGADSQLTRALNAGNADNIWLPNGSGGYDVYYIRSNGELRRSKDNVAVSNIPIIYTDGLLIEKKAAAGTLTVTGQVKTSSSSTTITNGFNLLSVVVPTGATLMTIGLDDDLTRSLSAGNADIVWIQQSNGSYLKYYLRPNGIWRETVANVDLTTADDVSLPSSILIEKKANGTSQLSLEVPDSYSDL